MGSRERKPLREYEAAAWWEPVAEPGQMGFVLFHRAPLTPTQVKQKQRANNWLVHDFQDKLWLVRSQEKVLRDAGYETFVARTVALPFDPSYAGIHPELVPGDGATRAGLFSDAEGDTV